MPAFSPIEAAIEIASALKECVQNLCDAYRARPPLIERERRAVRDHDLPEILALREVYEALNDKVETEVARLKNLGGRLVRLCRDAAPEAELAEPQTVSQMIAMMQGLRPASGGGLADKVLEHQLKGLGQDWEAFAAEKRKIEPLIATNAALLETLIDNYQKSYTFWQEQCERAISGYDNRGQQAGQGRLSGFAVRA